MFLSFLWQANVNGRVLSQCNLDDLKKEMEMNFGDWQLFRNTVRLFSDSYLDLMLLASDLLYLILQTMTIYGFKKKAIKSLQFMSVTNVHLPLSGICHFLFVPKADKAAFQSLHLAFRPKVQISHFAIRITRMAGARSPVD